VTIELGFERLKRNLSAEKDGTVWVALKKKVLSQHFSCKTGKMISLLKKQMLREIKV
jgi:hypothetical protein